MVGLCLACAVPAGGVACVRMRVYGRACDGRVYAAWRVSGEFGIVMEALGEMKNIKLGRLIIPVILLAVLVALYFFDVFEYLTYDTLKAQRETLAAWKESQGIVAILVFIAIYVAAVTFSVPGGLWLTVGGGFLFGTWYGSAYVVIGATTGALAVFLAAKYVVGDLLRAKAGGFIARMEAGFREDALSYMFVLRLIPAFPFWVVNLVPAFLNVPTRIYVIGTLFGIMPGTLVYANLGDTLNELIAKDEKPGLRHLLEPQIIIAISALIVLALVPVVYKRLAKAKAAKAARVNASE